MNRKNLFWAALSMTAALVMTACSGDSDVTETSDAPKTSTKSIPYTVTVNGGGTRATVDADNQTLRFAEDDKLYITGENIQGVLDIQSGVGETEDATFSGVLTYSGEGAPANNLELTATLVSAQQTLGTQVSVDGNGAVTVNYPTTAYCTSINDAVQQYSNLTGTSTYGAEAFELSQQTAFLNFEITFDDGTTNATTLSAVVSNGVSPVCTADVTTTTVDSKVVAKFVLPVAASTTLSSATVQLGTKTAISFGASQTLTGKVYNVKKTQLNANAISGKFSVSSTKQVYFSKGNLQATTSNNGTNWSWHFGPTQYARVGNGVANTTINGNGTVTNDGNEKNIDLFGWSTSVTHLGISNSTNNNNYSGDFVDWGSASEVAAGIGTGWRTLTGNEWYYLMVTRDGNKYAKASINGTRSGFILLPDDWKTTYYALNKINDAAADFSANKISSSVWTSTLEARGAVFLPVTGQRNSGTTVNGADTELHYWSSTGGLNANSAPIGDHLRYNSSGLAPNTGAGRCNGFAVRLVRDAN